MDNRLQRSLAYTVSIVSRKTSRWYVLQEVFYTQRERHLVHVLHHDDQQPKTISTLDPKLRILDYIQERLA